MTCDAIEEVIRKSFHGLEREIYSVVGIGGWIRKELTPTSDIDVAVFTKHEYIIPRKSYEELSKRKLEATEELKKLLEQQVSNPYVDMQLFDKGSVRDGRFCYLKPTFVEAIKRGRLIFGIPPTFSGKYPDTPEKCEIAYQVSQVRKYVLDMDYNLKHDLNEFVRNVKDSVRKMKGFEMTAVYLFAEKYIDGDEALIRELLRLMPDLDRNSLEKIKRARRNGIKICDARDVADAKDLLYENLSIRERIVKNLSEIEKESDK